MTKLPNDIDQLKAMLLRLQEEVIPLKKTLDTQAEEVVELNSQIQHLVEQLNLSKSKRFASQSEKIAKGTFNEAEQQDLLPKEKKKPESEAAKRGRKALPDTLYPRHLKLRACGKRVKTLSIDLLCDWPEREQTTPTQFQRRRVYSAGNFATYA